MIADIAAAIVRVRASLSDSGTSKLQRGENLLKPNGTQTIFLLANFNVVSGSVYVTQDASVRSQSGFTMDYPNGIITFTVAPVSTLTKFYVDYNYYFATDTEYTEFVNQALSYLGIAAVSDVPLGLEAALIEYAKYAFYTKHATEYANRYNSSGGIAGHQVESVTKNYLALATTAFKMAADLRNDYYERKGKRAAPASGSFNYNIDPYTPPR